MGTHWVLWISKCGTTTTTAATAAATTTTTTTATTTTTRPMGCGERVRCF